MKTQEIGCCRVWCREDPDAFLLHPDCYESLKLAWYNGEAFFKGWDCYGDEFVVKLGSIVAISRATPEAMASATADAKADKFKQEIE